MIKLFSRNSRVDTQIDLKLFALPLKRKYASRMESPMQIELVLEDLEEGTEELKDSIFIYDRAETERRKELAGDVLGDILHVRLWTPYNCWGFGMTEKVVNLMGMENMFCAMMTEETQFHELMSRLTDEMIRFLRWEEEQGVRISNNGNDYMGSGSFCFSDELPGNDFSGKVLSKHLWGHLNSQESVGISPEMYHEFIAPYYSRIAAEFGLLYYGCCEPVEEYWDDISKYPHLRKVSISPWCNEEAMAERLSDGRVIYSRKPSPNFLGIRKEFDAEEFRKYIRHTAQLIKKGKSEYIFRDIYKLYGNTEKLKQAVQIVREETEC